MLEMGRANWLLLEMDSDSPLRVVWNILAILTSCSFQMCPELLVFQCWRAQMLFFGLAFQSPHCK